MGVGRDGSDSVKKKVKVPWRCSLGFHDWDLWKDTGRGTEKVEGQSIGRPCIQQEQRCKKCNFLRVQLARY